MTRTINIVGRPKVDAPTGFVTLADAARHARVSYSTVYRQVTSELLRSRRLSSGLIVVDERDLAKITKHEAPVDRHRIAVQVRPSETRHAAWAAAAAAAGKGVTAWLYELADNASGFGPSEE